MSRYVILHHEFPAGSNREIHYDLMLEQEAGLLTWALPEIALDQPILCRRLKLHRLMYLSYEGPISGNRGSVRRWDGGQCTITECREDVLRATLNGDKLNVSLQLTREVDDAWQAVLASRPE